MHMDLKRGDWTSKCTLDIKNEGITLDIGALLSLRNGNEVWIKCVCKPKTPFNPNVGDPDAQIIGSSKHKPI